MEQHPVPQNVTTFQFRLIGDMTIKQFGYLAGGIILAYITYRLPLPFFFTWPLAILFGAGGFGFAFVPIEERPMDIWVLSFIKSIYSPTQYVWQKEVPAPATPMSSPTPGAQTTTSPSVRPMPDVLRGVFTPQPGAAAVPPAPTPTATPSFYGAKREPGHIVSVVHQTSPWDWLRSFFSFSSHPKPTPATFPTGNFPTPAVVGKRMDISPPPTVAPSNEKQQEALKNAQQKEEELEQELSTLKNDLGDKTMTETRVLELQKQLTEILTQKEKMQIELETLRRQTGAPVISTVTPISPTPLTPSSHVTTQQSQTVKIITPERAVKVGLPRLTTFPNVVTGIIKDSDNNLLPGVLVTVKDKDAMPLRALKTNRLGQFAASTPLANGVYFVEIEDPRSRFTFDRVQIALNGSIVPAIEIIAKSQKQINRAILEKELFGKPT